MRKSIVVFACIIAGAFAYLWQQTTSVRMGYKLSSLKSEYDRINAENDVLRLKINSVLSLEKMDKIAKEKKLYKPEEKSIMRID
jgi:cell division protein FtsL